ncbi:MAG TPA: DUF4249 family protein [Puia sp.]|nr:DUF4249 family protein [Puia sp.]
MAIDKFILFNRWRYGNIVFDVVIIFLSVFIFSCTKSGYNTKSLPDKLVVLAEITAGDTANIPIGSTLAAGTGNTIIFSKLDNVDAIITGQGAGTQTLLLNTTSDFTSNPMAVYSGTSVFVNNNTYTLSATDPLLGSIEATTVVPDSFSAKKTETETDDLNGKKVLRFAFTINDAAAQKNYYIFDAVKQLVNTFKYFYWQGTRYDYNTQQGYNLYQQVQNNPNVVLYTDTILTHQYLQLNVFTRDNNTANAGIGTLDSAYSRIFITDSLFNGHQYETEFYISRDYFKAADSTQKGVVQVRVKSVSKELYDYLFQYERYNLNFGNFPVGNLSSPQGNIKNGFGIFGGSARKQWSFYYDSL